MRNLDFDTWYFIGTLVVLPTVVLVLVLFSILRRRP